MALHYKDNIKLLKFCEATYKSRWIYRKRGNRNLHFKL